MVSAGRAAQAGRRSEARLLTPGVVRYVDAERMAHRTLPATHYSPYGFATRLSIPASSFAICAVRSVAVLDLAEQSQVGGKLALVLGMEPGVAAGPGPLQRFRERRRRCAAATGSRELLRIRDSRQLSPREVVSSGLAGRGVAVIYHRWGTRPLAKRW